MKKLKLPILIVLMTFNYIYAFGAISVEAEGNSILVESSLVGEAGYTGCDVASLKAVPGYIFDLQYKSNGNNPTCGRNSNDWTTIRKVRSQNEEIVFANLPPGMYKVIAAVATSDGCMVKRLGDSQTIETRTIVKESSEEVIIREKIKSKNLLSRSNQSKNTLQYLNENNISVYPNPANHQVFIEYKANTTPQSVHLSLIDLLGRNHIDQNTELVTGKKKLLDLTNIPNGAYLLQMTNEQGEQYITKLIRIANGN